jgi:hypothetical protein
MVIKILEELITDERTIRVLEHFIIHEEFEQNRKDLCEELKIYPRKMNEILEKLVEWEIIEVTKTIAKTNFYKVNHASKLINPLRVLIQEMSFINSLKISEIYQS